MAGQLCWSSLDFWQATFAELHYMHRGWLVSQGVDPDKNEGAATKDDLKRMMELFPDG